MRFVIVSLAVIVAAFAMADGENEKVVYDLNKAPELFDKFIKDFERSYKDDADKDAHYQAFRANLEKINKMNADSTTATFGINKFADYTEEERKQMFGLRKNV